jgi:hypothetical protein
MQKINSTLRRLGSIEYMDINKERGQYNDLIKRFNSDAVDYRELYTSLKDLDSHIEALYWTSTLNHLIDMFSELVSLPPDLYNLLGEAMAEYNASKWTEATSLAREAMSRLSTILPPVDVYIYDSRGTNSPDYVNWPSIE